MQAQPAPTTSASTTVEDRGTAFRAVDSSKETVAGGPLLVAAYIAVWTVVLLFVVRVFTRQNAVMRRIDDLEKAVRDKAKSS